MSNRRIGKLAERRSKILWIFIIAILVEFGSSNNFQIRPVAAAPPLTFGFPSNTHNISDDWVAHRARGSHT